MLLTAVSNKINYNNSSKTKSGILCSVCTLRCPIWFYLNHSNLFYAQTYCVRVWASYVAFVHCVVAPIPYLNHLERMVEIAFFCDKICPGKKDKIL